jgi:predicted Zn-dependent protease
MSSRLMVYSLALASAMFVTGSGSDAKACGGEWYPIIRIDPRIHGVAQAEKALNSGRLAEAGASVVRMIPHIKTLNGSKTPLIARAERVLALSLSRGEGALSNELAIPREVQDTWLGKNAEDRSANLTWAVSVLKRQSDKKQDDPALLTDLGEAMARLEAERPKARAILEQLAAKDLVATPEGYRALAELRRLAGDSKGEHVALERCRALAGKSGELSCNDVARG